MYSVSRHDTGFETDRFQVLDAVPNKKPSMFDLPSMAELGAEVRQGVQAAKTSSKGPDNARFSDAVDAAGQVTGA